MTLSNSTIAVRLLQHRTWLWQGFHLLSNKAPQDQRLSSCMALSFLVALAQEHSGTGKTCRVYAIDLIGFGASAKLS